jgi:hypothetical protein
MSGAAMRRWPAAFTSHHGDASWISEVTEDVTPGDAGPAGTSFLPDVTFTTLHRLL